VVAELKLPEESMMLFVCASSKDGDFLHQGIDEWLRLKSHKGFLPMWVNLLIIGTCLCFSALFSGLNLGLMSLDRTDLKVRDI
jgi:metal transporter CNNM